MCCACAEEVDCTGDRVTERTHLPGRHVDRVYHVDCYTAWLRGIARAGRRQAAEEMRARFVRLCQESEEVRLAERCEPGELSAYDVGWCDAAEQLSARTQALPLPGDEK